MTRAREVLVVPTGTANLASVCAALRRAGATCRICTRAEEISRAEWVVIPGVGSFASAMRTLRANAWDTPLRDRVTRQLPLLGICLGMQVFATASQESPGVDGLGILDQAVERFRSSRRVPQLGWNSIDAPPDADVLQSGYVYFANSYRLSLPPTGWVSAMSDHGGPFVAAVERGPVLLCQFHPELSGEVGGRMLERWLSRAGRNTAC